MKESRLVIKIQRIKKISCRDSKELFILQRLGDVIRDTSLCGLGQSAPNPVISGLTYFRDEWETHLFERECPAGVCKEILTYTIDNRFMYRMWCVYQEMCC